jgi:hypothetical protein
MSNNDTPSDKIELRDFLAGLAMASVNISEVLDAFRRNDYDGRQSHNVYLPLRPDETAKFAYEMADMMLKARNQ